MVWLLEDFTWNNFFGCKSLEILERFIVEFFPKNGFLQSKKKSRVWKLLKKKRKKQLMMYTLHSQSAHKYEQTLNNHTLKSGDEIFVSILFLSSCWAKKQRRFRIQILVYVFKHVISKDIFMESYISTFTTSIYLKLEVKAKSMILFWF